MVAVLRVILGTDVPDNILVNNPTDQRSRWSGGSGYGGTLSTSANLDSNGNGNTTIDAFIANNRTEDASARANGNSGLSGTVPTKLLAPVSASGTVTFGKYARAHPCNVREFKIWAGLTPDIKKMSLLYWGGLKNDAIPETFQVAYRNKEGIILPSEYVCIEPISAHSSNYNISIWHIALGGIDQEEVVEQVYNEFSEYQEVMANKLILKHLRQRGLLSAFEELQRSIPATSTVRAALEHPSLTELHDYLVRKGDFDAAESLISAIAYPTDTFAINDGSTRRSKPTCSLLDEYCRTHSPRVQWIRLDSQASVTSWDGTAPAPRGGHQLVIVRNTLPESSSYTGDIHTDGSPIDEDANIDDGSALYLFGGWDGTKELSDFWSFDLYEQRWKLLSSDTSTDGINTVHPDNTPIGPSPRSCHQMAVDQATGDIYLLGKFVDSNDQSPSGENANRALSALTQSVANNTSRSATPTPPGTAGPAPTNGTGRGTGGRRALEDITGIRIVGADSASGNRRSEAPATTGPSNDTAALETPGSAPDISITVADDDGKTSAVAPDFWVYHTRGAFAGKFERLSANTQNDGGPPLIFDHQMLVDSTGGKLYVFGGKFYDTRGHPHYSGLYSYSLKEGVWKKLFDDMGPPGIEVPSRIGHTMLLDEELNKLIILAGQRVQTYLSDLWTYDLNDGTLECLTRDYSCQGGPDGGFTQRATLDAKRREFILLSGLMRDKSPPYHTNVKNAIWIRSLDFGDWRKVESNSSSTITGQIHSDAMEIDQDEPKARFAHQFVYDPVKDEHFLFGGNPADATISARLGDFWKMRVLRITKGEVLRRCKFLIRRCKFYEMCNTYPQDSMNALLYLQTSLASVSGDSDQEEFLSCMSYLLAAKPAQGGPDAANSPLQGQTSEGGGDSMVVSQILPPRPSESSTSHKSDAQSWKRRTEVFEEILTFFPEKAKEPNDDLLSSAVAWEGVL